MSSTSKAWLVAASIGAVEALKDQGFCRWNYALRIAQRQASNGTNILRSKKSSSSSSSSSAIVANKMMRGEDHRLKQSEESLRKVMYLSCWGPY